MLFTIGYETATPESMVETLARAGVECVVDVRELPLSRRKGFSKTRLRDTLSDGGIGYTHVRALGNPKTNRELYKSSNIVEGARAYRERLLTTASAAVTELVESVHEHTICLLCLEESPADCHRMLVAERVMELDRRVSVVHL